MYYNNIIGAKKLIDDYGTKVHIQSQYSVLIEEDILKIASLGISINNKKRKSIE